MALAATDTTENGSWEVGEITRNQGAIKGRCNPEGPRDRNTINSEPAVYMVCRAGLKPRRLQTKAFSS